MNRIKAPAIVTALVAMLLALTGCSLFPGGTPDSNMDNTNSFGPQLPSAPVFVNEDNQITRVIDPYNNEVLYDEGWSDTDTEIGTIDGKPNGSTGGIIETEVVFNDKVLQDAAHIFVEINPVAEEMSAYVDYYNQHVAPLSPSSLRSTDAVRSMVADHILSQIETMEELPAIALISNAPPHTKSDKDIAKAAAEGLSAPDAYWMLYGIDYPSIEYVYGCSNYRIDATDADALTEVVRTQFPAFEVRVDISRRESITIKTEEPCDFRDPEAPLPPKEVPSDPIEAPSRN